MCIPKATHYTNSHTHTCACHIHTTTHTHTHTQIQAIVNGIRPIKRERKHSTSSSASSISAHSTSYHAPRFQQKNKNSAGQRHSAPFRAASDPEISMATRNSPTPVAKPWPTTLPSTTVSVCVCAHVCECVCECVSVCVSMCVCECVCECVYGIW